ncbi:hypothetical protein G6N05_02230 [Flavobacterium sp. F372]|jgi:hypothetical protein|uniref:SRPBCC family protein n=1 Tax=Flavobacterium bernardetii TaxID=2813823 RepID=A0ABR7IV69_9FLAO|nr:hypothetical protein [Flavobacterium bernardetii]MBC5833694.1 hypothetical protein [Flavobacterium bernardetii]NHF68927.1 hypothetical protein [Flavobacterium bernardetii]
MKKQFIAIVFMIGAFVNAQSVKEATGSLASLKDQTSVNVEFDYSNLKLLKENLTEAEYIKNRTEDLNKKTPGVGDSWAKKWAGSKEMIWNPKFLELVNVVLFKEKKNIVFKEDNKSAKYTVEVKVDWIFPGWDVAIMKQPAKVTTTIRLVETANRSNVLYSAKLNDAPGDQWGNNFSNESRIGEGFAKTGKTLAKLILKQIK